MCTRSPLVAALSAFFLAAATVTLVGLATPVADAIQVDCEDLTYEQVIVTPRCRPTAQPGPINTPDDGGGAGEDASDGDGGAGDNAGDGGGDTTDGGDTGFVDRQSRGLRQPYEGDIGVVLLTDAGDDDGDGLEVDEDPDADSSQSEAPSDDDDDDATASLGEDEAAADEATTEVADGPSEEAAAGSDTAGDVAGDGGSGTWLLVGGIVALLAAGVGLQLGRRRQKSRALAELPETPRDIGLAPVSSLASDTAAPGDDANQGIVEFDGHEPTDPPK